MSYRLIIPVLWLAWFAVRMVFARRVKADAAREGVASRLTHVLPLLVAAYLLAAPNVPVPLLDARFLPPDMRFVRLGTSLTFAGLAFAVWARVWLAGNWSGAVTLKHGHTLVVTGPYQWVRRPIDAGLLLALIGTAVAVGEGRAILAVVLAAAALWRKLRVEEAVMRREFGDAYRNYANRTRALIPFVL
ncbi:protein-S-isoprenylcysteine O-methyltransferase Ste14 [Roseiarcus fermentans]|uniref:Protein-S-isoprenylcysteine O-methyltransferase Ste14 n=1 Tax=Roseiarcus fermentans TaxID=1473586 RepID=A0A366F1R1_9HYPH|nr:isoprenylcysteine carboxylmethyltransferase family protein [Roseiarcus fermentans]RBP08581.1 protein-S-isoprenylcysteine O-methyltransferase Ste14 [Roseiarcus fermentans]